MDRIKGIAAVVISAVVFGSMPLMAKTIYAEGGNSVTLSFLRFTLVIPLLIAFIASRKNVELKLTSSELKKLLIVGPLGYGVTTLTLYMSYDYISSGVATTLHFGYPVLVILAYVILFKERAGGVKLTSVALTAIGIILLNEPGSNLDIRGVALALTSAAAYAFYIVFLDRSGLKRMYPLKLTLYLCITAGAIILVFGMATGVLDFTMTLKGWLVTVLLSMSVAVFGVSLFQVGVALVGPQTTSILSTFEPITGILIGILIFSEALSIRTGAGLASILVAVVLVTVFDKS
jgi:drug/metabolite transporter (DMT)-like permease